MKKFLWDCEVLIFGSTREKEFDELDDKKSISSDVSESSKSAGSLHKLSWLRKSPYQDQDRQQEQDNEQEAKALDSDYDDLCPPSKSRFTEFFPLLTQVNIALCDRLKNTKKNW